MSAPRGFYIIHAALVVAWLIKPSSHGSPFCILQFKNKGRILVALCIWFFPLSCTPLMPRSSEIIRRIWQWINAPKMKLSIEFEQERIAKIKQFNFLCHIGRPFKGAAWVQVKGSPPPSYTRVQPLNVSALFSSVQALTRYMIGLILKTKTKGQQRLPLLIFAL